MRIEKLTENKIRIILNLEDLKENNVDLHSFMSNSIETQDLFLEMLDKAEAEVGFKTQDYKLIIEALASSDGNFIVTVTRLSPETDNKISKKNIKTKRKPIVPSKTLSIYRFNNFDDFNDFCNQLNSGSLHSIINKFSSSSLYLYNNNYYLILNNIKINLEQLKSFCYIISEFGTYVHESGLFERKLKEYGKLIVRRNAINTFLKYFN